MMLAVYVAIVKLQFFHSGFSFFLRIVNLNPSQVFTDLIFLGYHIIVFFIFRIVSMI